MDTSSLAPSSLAQIIAAIGTVSAVVIALFVALFRDSLFAWLRRPVLRVTASLVPPHCHRTQMQINGADLFNCYYLRLWIENDGRRRADTVQVYAAQLTRRNDAGSFENVVDFLPMNLTWTHTGDTFSPGISPLMGQHCDLGYVVDPFAYPLEAPAVIGQRQNTRLDLCVEMRTFLQRHVLRPRRYRLRLKVAAANARPRDYTVELMLSGEWFEDEREMFGKGLGLRLV